MLLKPLSSNAFFAGLLVLSTTLVSVAMAQPVFGTLMHSPIMQGWLREVVVPMFL